MSWRRGPPINGREWELVRRQVFARDGYRCVACGRAARLECDHVRPLNRGGARLDPRNLQSLCRTCHVAKTADENSGTTPAQRAEQDKWRALLAAIAKA